MCIYLVQSMTFMISKTFFVYDVYSTSGMGVKRGRRGELFWTQVFASTRSRSEGCDGGNGRRGPGPGVNLF